MKWVQLIWITALGLATLAGAPAYASRFEAGPLVCTQSEGAQNVQEIETDLLKRVHFAKERRDTAKELSTVMDDLRFGAKTRAIFLTGANSVFLTLLYARIFVLAARLAAVEVGEAGGLSKVMKMTLNWIGNFSKKSIRTGSYKKALAADVAYSGGQLLFIETAVKKWGGHCLGSIKQLATGEVNVPRVLDFSSKGIKDAFKYLEFQNREFERLKRELTPQAREKRNVVLLGWDDYYDFIILSELAAAQLRILEHELKLSEYLLNQLRGRCVVASSARLKDCNCEQGDTQPFNFKGSLKDIGGSTLLLHYENRQKK